MTYDLFSKYKVIKTFPVLYEGWECDYTGYILDINGKHTLVLTDHGRPYIAKAKQLEEKVKEYRKVLKESKEALKLLYRGKNETNNSGQ